MVIKILLHPNDFQKLHNKFGSGQITIGKIVMIDNRLDEIKNDIKPFF